MGRTLPAVRARSPAVRCAAVLVPLCRAFRPCPVCCGYVLRVLAAATSRVRIALGTRRLLVRLLSSTAQAARSPSTISMTRSSATRGGSHSPHSCPRPRFRRTHLRILSRHASPSPASHGIQAGATAGRTPSLAAPRPRRQVAAGALCPSLHPAPYRCPGDRRPAPLRRSSLPPARAHCTQGLLPGALHRSPRRACAELARLRVLRDGAARPRAAHADGAPPAPAR
jgi:hypothetical protein